MLAIITIFSTFALNKGEVLRKRGQETGFAGGSGPRANALREGGRGLPFPPRAWPRPSSPLTRPRVHSRPSPTPPTFPRGPPGPLFPQPQRRARVRRSGARARAGSPCRRCRPARPSPLRTAPGASAALWCAGLPRRVGGPRCGEEACWEGSSGRPPAPSRPRPWESLAAQTEGK